MKSLVNTKVEFSKKFGRRTFLPARTQSLWKIERGVVRTITWLEDGTTVTLGVWGPGDIVGQLLSKIEPYEIECLTTVEASVFPLEGWVLLHEALSAHIRQAQELIMIRSHKTLDIVIMKLFSWLAKDFGREVETGQLIDLRLTHQDIAELVGTTRVTVTRVLTQLEEQGFIQRLPLHLTVVQTQDFWHYEI